MTSSLLISGTGREAGRATISCALAFAFKVRRMRVGVMKPAETGCAEHNGLLEPRGAIALVESASTVHPLDMVCPFRYRSALAPPDAAAADGAAPPELARIEALYRRIAAESDVVIVDGADDLATRLTPRDDYAALAARLGLDVVLAAANGAACVSGTLRALEHGANRALRVRGYIVIDAEPAPPEQARATVDALSRLTRARCLGIVRHKEPLGLAIVEQLL
jgi:dethiobiotin synthetase